MKRFVALALASGMLLSGCSGATTELKYKELPEERRGAIQHTQGETAVETEASTESEAETEVATEAESSEAAETEAQEPNGGKEVGSVEVVLDLYRKGVVKNENWCFSPYSLQDCLSMLAVDVQGTTKEEFEKLGIADYQVFVDYDANTPEGLNISNRGYINESMSVFTNPDFVRPGCELVTLPFDEAALQQINDNVKTDTNGKIDSIFDSLDPDMASCFVNAVYFNNRWDFEAEDEVRWKDETRAGFSGDVAADSVKELTPKVDMLRLEYPGTDFSMYVICSNDYNEGTAADVDAFMDNEFTMSMLTKNDKAPWTEASFYMPSFEFDSMPNVQGALKDIGVTSIFGDKADFGQLGQIYVGNMVQKTYVKVNNKGTEAAAVTGLEMCAMSAIAPNDSKTVHVVDDFVFIIKDEAKDAVLFMGRVADPQGKNE